MERLKKTVVSLTIADMGSGAVVDFNTGILLWHIGARVQYLNAFSLAGEA